MRRRRAGTLLGAALLSSWLGRHALAEPPEIKRESRSFLLFFGPGAIEIAGDYNARTLREVAAVFRDGNCEGCGVWTGPLFVAAHTDRGEAPSAAARLSLSRARGEAVQHALAALGIPAGQLAVGAYGASRLLAPNDPGLLEPQNRRVEISFFRPGDWPG